MVCEKCQKKLGRVITSDTWKAGARNTIESGGKKVGENKLLTAKKNRWTPYQASSSGSGSARSTSFNKCRVCGSAIHQAGAFYCHGCAYKKGICAMCGRKMLDTAQYQQRTT